MDKTRKEALNAFCKKVKIRFKNLEMLDSLIEDHKLELYDKEKDDYTIPSIRLVKQE